MFTVASNIRLGCYNMHIFHFWLFGIYVNA